jgi:FkbM family methyltransferase
MMSTWQAWTRTVAKRAIPAPIKALRWRVPWLHGRGAFAARPAATLWRLARWTVKELCSPELEFTAADGTRFVSMRGNSVSFLLFVQGELDGGVHAFIARRLQPGATFVDVGANIGLYTVPAARHVGPEGRVIAIEAHPRTFEFLCRNVALNALDNVVTIQRAVGDSAGSVTMVYREADAGSSFVAADPIGGVEVPVETLDAILARASVATIDYLKIDVEGYELPVLRGARGIIAASPGIVVQVEHAEANRYGHSLDAVAELLFGLKLMPFRPDASGVLHAAQPDRLGADAGDVLWLRPSVPK